MKNLALLATILLTTTVSYAVRNPQIRACHAAGGQFMVVNSTEDQIGLCKFGFSLVGSIDILNKDARIEVPLSLHHYKKGVQLCGSQNQTTLTTFEGEEISFCQYYDGSLIDIETLASGKNSGRNPELNSVLGL